MNTDFSIVRLILDASIVVQLVLLLLLLASIASWAVIIDKRRVLKQAMKTAGEFETSFWSGVDLGSLYREMARADATPLGIRGRRAEEVADLALRGLLLRDHLRGAVLVASLDRARGPGVGDLAVLDALDLLEQHIKPHPLLH